MNQRGLLRFLLAVLAGVVGVFPLASAVAADAIAPNGESVGFMYDGARVLDGASFGGAADAFAPPADLRNSRDSHARAVRLRPADELFAPSRVPVCLRSFSADTEVLLGDGVTTKPISELEPGDEIWATDPETGESGPRQVEAVWPHYDWLLELDVEGGSVTTTEDHHFWNETDREWQETQYLDAGDLLRTPAGDRIAAGALDWSTWHYDEAYDLTVEGVHTYYVSTGEDDVLVHNCNLPRLGHRNVLEGPLPGGNRPLSSWTRDDLVQLRDDLVVSLRNRKAEIGTDFPFDPTDYIHPKRIQDETDLLVAVEKALSGS